MNDYNPREYWSHVADEIAERSAGNVIAGDDTPFYEYKRDAVIARFLRRMPVAGANVLEVGCGPGGNLAEVARLQPSRLVGCDISARMLALARRTTAGTPVELVEVDGDTLPFADAEFSLTYSVTVVQHNHEPRFSRMIAEMCRVTARSVRMIEGIAPVRDEGYAFVLRPADEYVRVCEANGFRFTGAEPLRVAASEWVADRLRRKLNPRSRAEGDPVTPMNRRIERGVLPVTKVLDRVVTGRRGLMMLSFERA